MITKTGIFSIVGRPNAGKSTLLNALCGTKVSIVSQKPQTTRTRITGIRNTGDCQLVFMDTPGLHKARNRLGDFMTRVIEDTVSDVDAAILIVEPVARIGIPEQILIDKIKAEKIPAVLVINKIDTIKEKEELLEVIRVYSEACEFCEVVPLSARNRDGVDALTRILCSMCIESPQLYPDDMLSDQPARAFAAELVREKLLMCLDKEIPHGVAVEIEQYDIGETLCEISAVIYCERTSHKGIIIGKKGDMLKRIGALARSDMEKKLGKKVFLQLWVKVKEDWRNNPAQVKNFGYYND
ncbi:MAG: GTPase Era [Clostridia bacterium]|nr:GTPase Era [Clostridia bacterium]